MSGTIQKYYTSYENKPCGTDCSHTDLPSPEAVKETSGFTRRSFLKTTGFSFAAFMTACSKTPVRKAIPFFAGESHLVCIHQFGLREWLRCSCKKQRWAPYKA